MIGNPQKPGVPRDKSHEKARDAVRVLLHEFYIEIATTRMSKETFEEFLDRFIEAATTEDEE